MKRDSVLVPEEDQIAAIEAAKHVARARHLLTCLRDKLVGCHTWPELEEAVVELEVALSILTAETGGSCDAPEPGLIAPWVIDTTVSSEPGHSQPGG